MNYREIKNLLKTNGFVLDSYQTSGCLDMVSFVHPKINGDIAINFNNNIIIPNDIGNGKEFDYDDDNETWLLDSLITDITVNIDISISFTSEDTIDIGGSNYENIIFLYGDDLNLIYKLIPIIIDPYGSIEFQKEYSKEVDKFFRWVENYLPIIKKNLFFPQIFSTNGNENTLYKNICISFYLDKNDNCIVFYLDVLTWRKSIAIKIEPGFMLDSGFMNENNSLDEFEKEVNKQIEEKNKFYKEILNK